MVSVNVDIENAKIYQLWIDYLAKYVDQLMETTHYQKLVVSLELLLSPDSTYSFAPRKNKPVVLDNDQRLRLTEEIERRFRELFPHKNPRYAFLGDALFQFLVQASNPDKTISAFKNLPETLLIKEEPVQELTVDFDKTEKLPEEVFVTE